MTTIRRQCQALDDHGRKCRRLAVLAMNYHGDEELYGFFSLGPEPGWVEVWLCDEHSKAPRRQK